MSNQPRDSNGEFTRFDSENPEELSKDGIVGVYDESQITPTVEFSNVQIDELERAIEMAKEWDNNIRIGVINKRYQKNGKAYEQGVVFLKGKPSDEKVVALAGMRREWKDD